MTRNQKTAAARLPRGFKLRKVKLESGTTFAVENIRTRSYLTCGQTCADAAVNLAMRRIRPLPASI